MNVFTSIDMDDVAGIAARNRLRPVDDACAALLMTGEATAVVPFGPLAGHDKVSRCLPAFIHRRGAVITRA